MVAVGLGSFSDATGDVAGVAEIGRHRPRCPAPARNHERVGTPFGIARYKYVFEGRADARYGLPQVVRESALPSQRGASAMDQGQCCAGYSAVLVGGAERERRGETGDRFRNPSAIAASNSASQAR